jgi:L-amino acid N-acyltransferase YncA
MKIQVRGVTPQDAAGIVDILNPIIATGEHTVLTASLTPQEERDYILQFHPRGVFHVAERLEDGRLVGLQSLEPFGTYSTAFDHVAVMGTFVDLAHRRRGIASELSEVTFAAAKAKGFKKVFTYVRADNLASLGFHLKCGFHVVGMARQQALIQGRYVDEVFIEKFL